MRILLLVFLALTSLQAIELDWIHDYKQALQEAKKRDKSIYLFIGADKCRFCDMFKQRALSRDSVIKRLEKEYVLVYLSRDRHKIPKGLETQGVPKHYFLTKEGKQYFHTWGYYDCKGFHLILDEAEMYKED
jgi:thioredoxin-related protein